MKFLGACNVFVAIGFVYIPATMSNNDLGITCNDMTSISHDLLKRPIATSAHPPASQTFGTYEIMHSMDTLHGA